MHYLPFLTLLFTCFVCTGARAQTTIEPREPSPITYQRGFLTHTYYYDNLVVEGLNFRRALRNDPDALRVLTGSGFMEFSGVFLATFGALVALEAFSDDPDGRLFDNNGTSLGVGIGLLGVGTGLVLLADGKRRRAVNIYNTNLGYDGYTARPGWKIEAGPTQNGVGLVASF